MSEHVSAVWRGTAIEAGGRLRRPGGQVSFERVDTLKEGARGGTTGSPTLDQVEPRRAFIEQNAKDVKYLDV